jgi:hypothetical protein
VPLSRKYQPGKSTPNKFSIAKKPKHPDIVRLAIEIKENELKEILSPYMPPNNRSPRSKWICGCFLIIYVFLNIFFCSL